MNTLNTLNASEIQHSILINSELSQHKTNHILHLLLTLFTAGLWSFFWVIATAATNEEKNKIRRRYGLNEKFNAPSFVLVCCTVFIAAVIIVAMVNG